MKNKKVSLFYKDYTKYKAHIGHKSLNIVSKKRSHPYSVSFLLCCKNKHVNINPLPFLENFIKSLHIFSLFFKNKKKIYIVNTNKDYNHYIYNFYRYTLLEKKYIYYCNEKWVGGFCTNWKQVSLSIQTYMAFKERFETFISKNNINFPRYKKMNIFFKGLVSSSECKFYKSKTLTAHRLKKEFFKKSLNKPDLLFLINPNENRHVVEEAVSLNIPVVAITDSHTSLLGISYPIPGNSNSIEFVHYCLQWIARVIQK